MNQLQEASNLLLIVGMVGLLLYHTFKNHPLVFHSDWRKHEKNKKMFREALFVLAGIYIAVSCGNAAVTALRLMFGG